ncbi:DNA polymerase ligase N-terminal domain-containing protein [Mycobacterium ahvazicum]|nr:DNA polymerase ligase N-terminal domain-containing protein [Mycobacterium ahvazicum]
MPLSEYRRKRRFRRSPEPRGRLGRRRRAGTTEPSFVIQHHAARSDHYDLRLEIQGVLVSWVIANGPSANPRDRRLARRTEDHPLDYAEFEGVIPEGEYGAGPVIVWDRGSYTNETAYEMAECLARGHVSFHLQGEKLTGGFTLTKVRDGADETWLLIKRKDEGADPRRQPVRSQPESVLSGRTLDDLDKSS